MKESSIIEILKTFSEKELNQFGDFLNSPFHNKNSKAVQLFNLLKKYHPEYKSNDLSKENLFISLCGNDQFKESYIRNLLSDLNLLAENFLRQINFQSSCNNQIHLIEESFSRGLDKVLQKKLDSFESFNKSEKYRDSEYFYRKMYIETVKAKMNHDKALIENFREKSIESVVSHFLILAMENSFQLLVEEQRVKINHNLDLLKLIVLHYKRRIDEFKETPLIQILLRIGICFLEFENENHYKKLEDSFKTHYEVLEKIDRRNIYAMMQTYCQKKIEKGKNIYKEKVLNMMIEMLERNSGAAAESEYLNLNFCRNLILSASSKKKISVIELFISKYLSKVNPSNRASMEHFAYAHLYFHQNKFPESLKECNEIFYDELFMSTNDNMYFKNDIKKLTLACYYELKYFENALTHIDAHKHFLNKSKLMKDSMKEQMHLFLKLTDELIKLNFNYDEFKYSTLQSQISKLDSGWNKDWLQSKANDYRRK